jgi:phospholipase C
MTDSNLKKTRSKKLGRNAKAEDRATIDLNLIETIVIVMMENRSFDHMPGHLSYRQYANGTKVDGLQDLLNQQAYENIYAGEPYYPFEMKDGTLPSDLPHEREYVKTQLAYSPVTGSFSMSGFVDAYYQFTTVNRTERPEPMGFFPPSEVPITNFLASNFAVCDRWFAPLPTSTHPNRCMALGGSTPIDSTGEHDHSLKVDSLVLDWLDENGISWRVYQHGALSSFYLFRLGFVLDPRFLSFDRLKDDINAPDGEFPHIVFIEPSYAGSHQNDNHPPIPVGYGELFLNKLRLKDSITGSSMRIVTRMDCKGLKLLPENLEG